MTSLPRALRFAAAVSGVVFAAREAAAESGVSLHGSAIIAEGGALPILELGYRRRIAPGLDLVAEAATIGLATIAQGGLRLVGGDAEHGAALSLGVMAGGGYLFVPDFFGETELFLFGALTPGVAASLATERLRITLAGEALWIVPYVAMPKPSLTVAVRISDSVSVIVRGAVLIDLAEDRAFPVVSLGIGF